MAYTGKFANEINKAAAAYQVDPFLVAAVIQTESSFNPKAHSKAGAEGLMQLMPATAKSMGVKDAYDPEQNVMGGTRYLAGQLHAFGSVDLALAAYNAGGGNVRKYGGIPPFKETQNYVKKVKAAYNTFTKGKGQTVADDNATGFSSLGTKAKTIVSSPILLLAVGTVLLFKK